MNKKYCTLLAFFITALSLSAQDWVADMKKMNKVYSEAHSFSMNISVKVYEKVNSVAPMMTYAGNMAKSELGYCSELMGKTTLVNDRVSLLIDKNQRLILYKKVTDKNKQSLKPPPIPMSVDSAMYANAKVKYLINNATEKKIQIISKGTAYSKVEISINTADNTMKQIIFYTENNNGDDSSTEKVVVDYTNVKINTTISSAVFAEQKFIVVTGKKATTTKAYSGYQLIDENTPVK
jgi:hypothetical protein